MFELTTCVVVDGKGRDCNGPRPEDAPIPLCLTHMRMAYRFFADYLEMLPERSEQDEADRSRGGDAEDPVSDLEMFEPYDASVVYYVLIGDLIKIGFTTSFQTRMVALMPDEILGREPGGRELEARRHLQFDLLRAPKGREYFYRGAELMDHIRALPPYRQPLLVARVPGPVIGPICASCDMRSVWNFGAGRIECRTCGAPFDVNAAAT